MIMRKAGQGIPGGCDVQAPYARGVALQQSVRNEME